MILPHYVACKWEKGEHSTAREVVTLNSTISLLSCAKPKHIILLNFLAWPAPKSFRIFSSSNVSREGNMSRYGTHIFLSSVRKCPYCGSTAVRPSKRFRFKDDVVGLLLLKPYRCESCNERHYNVIWAKRTARASESRSLKV